MPSFTSNKGVWYPARETIGLVYHGDKEILKEDLPKGVTINSDVLKKGQPFLYDGPDRAALGVLAERKVESFGRDFRHDPEFLQAVRNMGFSSVEDYLKHVGYDEKADQKKYKEKTAKVRAHEIPQRVAEIKVMGGGRDTSDGAQHRYGGFGEPHETPAGV